MAHTNKEISKQFKKHITISKRGLSRQYENTTACQSFYNADQMTYEDRIQFADSEGRRRRATVTFNKVQPNVDAVVGFMAQNRRQAKYVARQNENQGQNLYSKNMNSLYDYHREKTNADQLETEQDFDMMISGVGAVETDLSYIIGNATNTPYGNLVKIKLDPIKTGWDPNCKNKNLLGAGWAYYFEDYELTTALSLFQGSTKDDFESVSEVDSSDTGYVYNPYGGLYDKIKMLDNVEWSAKEQDMVRIYNYQWMEYETFYRAANPLYTVTEVEDALFMRARLDLIKLGIKSYSPEGITAGDLFDFDPLAEELVFDEETKNKLVKEFGEFIEPVPYKRECYYTAVVSGDHVFTHFKSISQQGFSIKFKTGAYNNQEKMWVGMVNAMMEPQKYYNKAVTEFMFTVAAMSKGGVMIEEDAVEDIADFESKWAKTDAVIKVAPGSLSGGKIKEKQQAMLPNGIDTILTLSDAAIASAGVDPSFLGQMDNEDQSGILYKRRIRQVISKMARYFDSITLYQKEDARLCSDLIRVWIQNNHGQWINITGDMGAREFVELSDDMISSEYDVSIQEAPQSPEDRQQTAAVLVTYGDKMLPFNPQAGQAFYAESLQMLPLDGDVRNRLMEGLKPKEDTVPIAQYQQLEQVVQQLQSQMQQLQMMKLQSDIDYNTAKTDKERAMTAETLESAANKGLENDILRDGGYSEANVTI